MIERSRNKKRRTGEMRQLDTSEQKPIRMRVVNGEPVAGPAARDENEADATLVVTVDGEEQ